MNKMTVIQILNKIANGEEVKFKIIDEQLEYYCKKDDFLRDRNNQEVDWWLDSLWLNKEVEIIEEEPRDIEVCGSWFTKSEYDKLAHSEEDKKIKPIEWDCYDDNYQLYYNGAMNYVSRAELELALKINEIIEVINDRD